MKPKALAATHCSDLDEFVDGLDEMLLPVLAREIEEQFVFNTTPTRAAPEILGSASAQSDKQHVQFPFGFWNSAIDYQEAA